jgi:uncharacterized membrane protein
MICNQAAIQYALGPWINFPHDAALSEEIALRWIHVVAGIIWIGLLYFFNFVGFPLMKQMDASTRGKVYPALMTRAMWWFRWSAVVTVLVGLRYYAIILSDDAKNAPDPGIIWRWWGGWLLVWLVAFALIYPLQMPQKGFLGSAWTRGIGITVIVVAASWIVLDWNSGPGSSNAHLAISAGGGMGLLMLLNTWGIVWRAQKRLIAWTRASAEQGAAMPAEAERLARWSYLALRTGFWLSFPMLFFMAAAEHYPFLISLGN